MKTNQQDLFRISTVHLASLQSSWMTGLMRSLTRAAQCSGVNPCQVRSSLVPGCSSNFRTVSTWHACTAACSAVFPLSS